MQKNIFNINILSFNRKKIIMKEYLYNLKLKIKYKFLN